MRKLCSEPSDNERDNCKRRNANKNKFIERKRIKIINLKATTLLIVWILPDISIITLKSGRN